MYDVYNVDVQSKHRRTYYRGNDESFIKTEDTKSHTALHRNVERSMIKTGDIDDFEIKQIYLNNDSVHKEIITLIILQ